MIWRDEIGDINSNLLAADKQELNIFSKQTLISVVRLFINDMRVSSGGHLGGLEHRPLLPHKVNIDVIIDGAALDRSIFHPSRMPHSKPLSNGKVCKETLISTLCLQT